MKNENPPSLIAAEAALTLFVIYNVILFCLNIHMGSIRAAPIIHLIWSLSSLIGIIFRNPTSLRLARIAIVFFVTMGTIYEMVFLLVLRHCELHISLLWQLFVVMYLFFIYYLLRKQSTIHCFPCENDKSLYILKILKIILIIFVVLVTLCFTMAFLLFGFDFFWRFLFGVL
jgi:hypothetical protein